MKRILAILLALVMVLSLVACGKENTTSEPDKTETLTTIMENDNVVVKGNEDAFPKNTVVKAEKVTEGDKFTTADTALKETATKFQLYDITAISDNVAVQPNGTVKATFDIPADFDVNKIAVVYISDDGKVETLSSTVDAKSKTVTVELSHFSLYAIIEVIETNTTESTDDTEQTESTITDSSSETSTPSSSSSKPTESSKPVTASENGGSGDTEQDGSGTGSANCDHSAGNYSYEFVPNVDDGTHNITCEDCGTLIAENQAHTMIWEDYTEPNEDGYVHRHICKLCRDDSGYIAPHFDNNGDGLCDVCNEIIVADLLLTVDIMGLMQVDNPMANATTYEFYVNGELKFSGADYVIDSDLDLSGCTIMVNALNSKGEIIATGTLTL